MNSSSVNWIHKGVLVKTSAKINIEGKRLEHGKILSPSGLSIKNANTVLRHCVARLLKSVEFFSGKLANKSTGKFYLVYLLSVFCWGFNSLHSILFRKRIIHLEKNSSLICGGFKSRKILLTICSSMSRFAKLTLPTVGKWDERPCPGNSTANIDQSSGKNLTSSSKLPALSCQPCKAKMACFPWGPHHLPERHKKNYF